MDDDGEESLAALRARIEAEHTKGLLSAAAENTARKAVEQEALRQAALAGSAAGPTPALSSTGKALSWAEARRTAKAEEGGGKGVPAVEGVKNDRILSEDTKAFPSLSGSAP